MAAPLRSGELKHHAFHEQAEYDFERFQRRMIDVRTIIAR
jgi:hypothetical protein